MGFHAFAHHRDLDHLRRRVTLLLGYRQVRQRIPLGKPSQIVGSTDLPGGHPSTAVAVGGNQLAVADRQAAEGRSRT